MAEPMSEERLAQCRNLPQLIRRHTWTAAEDAADAIRDLTAEVERLCAVAAKREAYVEMLGARCRATREVAGQSGLYGSGAEGWDPCG